MKIIDLIDELERIERKHGNIEVTCTATTDPETEIPQLQGGPYESTVENLIIANPDEKWKHGKRVRIFW